jgi:hypothetical protein
MSGKTHTKKHTKNTNHKDNKLQYKENDDECYGTIICDKGHSLFELLNDKNEVVYAKARGSISRGPGKQRLAKGDLVLIQKDTATTSKDKYFILIKYLPHEVKRLRKAGELNNAMNADDSNITFEEEDEDEATKTEKEFVDLESLIASI